MGTVSPAASSSSAAQSRRAKKAVHRADDVGMYRCPDNRGAY